MDYDPRIKLNVFDDPTTYGNDFRKFIPDKRYKHTWPKDRTERPTKPLREFRRLDPESYQPWRKGVDIPFHLMVQPRPITDTCPYTTYPPPEKPIDKGKDEAIKTRPRLYVCPAVSMDDIPDPEMRNLMCQYMYITDWKKAEKEAADAQTITKRVIPESTVELESDPARLKTDVYPPLPPGWREKGKTWDGKQRRACVDATETFWLNKDPPIKCGACTNPFKNLVSREVKDEIAKLIDNDKLRLQHDYPSPGYAGYKPMLSQGVPLSKVELPVTHPFLSSAQAISQRYADDKRSQT